MKIALSICLLMIPFLAFGENSLSLQGKVIDTLDSVDLISQDKVDDDRGKYGIDYFVRNRSDHPIYVALKATNRKNIYSNLPESEFIVDTGEKVYMGWVIQVNQGEGSQWEMEWRVER